MSDFEEAAKAMAARMADYHRELGSLMSKINEAQTQFDQIRAEMANSHKNILDLHEGVTKEVAENRFNRWRQRNELEAKMTALRENVEKIKQEVRQIKEDATDTMEEATYLNIELWLESWEKNFEKQRAAFDELNEQQYRVEYTMGQLVQGLLDEMKERKRSVKRKETVIEHMIKVIHVLVRDTASKELEQKMETFEGAMKKAEADLKDKLDYVKQSIIEDFTLAVENRGRFKARQELDRILKEQLRQQDVREKWQNFLKGKPEKIFDKADAIQGGKTEMKDSSEQSSFILRRLKETMEAFAGSGN